MLSVKIGLEIHCQLTELNSKLFCSCYCNYRGKDPNTNVCPICLGLPGTLPSLNKRAIEFAIMISKSLNCQTPEEISFSRKNYFYPDLPKNFQITQYDTTGISVGKNGEVEHQNKIARIRRVQLEEDPGRITYEDGKFQALIDYNRSGVGLVEIVTEPDFTDPKDVRTFLNKMTSILEHLNVCNTNLEGSLRCDVNISIGEGKKVEIKNIGSFKDSEKALTYEITRQSTMNLHDIEIKEETRHWDDKRKITKSARSKEGEEDYRYFPEPDIPIILLGREYLSILRIPELPDKRKNRFIENYGLSEHVASVLIEHKQLADLFEAAVKKYNSPISISNWIVSDIMGYIDYDIISKKSMLSELKIKEDHIVELSKLVDEGKINRNTAKDIITRIVKTGELPSKIIREKNVSKITEKNELGVIIKKIFDIEIEAVKDAKENKNAINFLLGKVMKETSGRADPDITISLIKEKLYN